MKRNFICCIIFYLAALMLISIYFIFDITPKYIMNPIDRLVLLCMGCLSLYIGSLLLVRNYENTKKDRIMRVTFIIFFILYISLIFTLTNLDIKFGRSFSGNFIWNKSEISSYIANSVNFIPFKTIYTYINCLAKDNMRNIALVNIFGNIVAFMPFAFFIPLIFRKVNSFIKFLICMVIIVILVELMQVILVSGSCDIDDLILNVAGAVLTYGFLQIEKVKKCIFWLTKLEY